MCDEVVDVSLAALKLIPSRMAKKLYTALCVDENILYRNEDSGNVVFSCNEMDILNVDLSNINLDNNFDEDNLDPIILVRLGILNLKNAKHLKKDK